MRKKIQKMFRKQTQKVVPAAERFAKWLVRSTFELFKLAALGYCVMLLISAPAVVEYVLASTVVFAAFYFTKIWK